LICGVAMRAAEELLRGDKRMKKSTWVLRYGINMEKA
jgi:hypothetical protein